MQEGTKVIRCDCKSELQDERYGVGQRVHNKAKGKSLGGEIWRCSVCGKEK